MKKKIFISVWLLCMSTYFFAQHNDTVSYTIPNNAYNAGEKLDFLIYYGVMKGGKATIQLREFSHEQGETIYHAKAEAETVGIPRMFIALDDVYESYFNEANCLPVKSVRNIKENNYRFYNEVVFDQETHRVKSQKSGIVDVPGEIYDIISSVYYMRRVGFDNVEINDTVSVLTYFADEIFEYEIVYKGKDEVSTKLGTFNALKFQPVVETGRVFENEDDMRFWLSDDAGYVPLRVEFDMLIGSLKCDLIGHSGLKNALNSK
ncbi:MAG: DUF3108 domain-containing protein [Bacteroidales bacterium]